MDLGGAALLLCWLAGWVLLLRVPQLPPGGSRRPGRTSVVVVRAGHEDEALSRLRVFLDAQSEPPDEVIVVDDSGEVPPGWTGKAWSFREGARRATGEWLIFLDARVELAPDALGRLLAAHAGDPQTLVSVAPYHVVRKPHEHLSLFFDVVAAMRRGMATALPLGPQVGAFGPCLACRREDYLAADGQEAVRALAVRSYGGRRTVGIRMYPQGLRRLVEGQSQNLAAGAGTTPLLRRALVVAWIVGSIAAAATGAGWPYLAFAVQLGAMAIQLGSFSTFAVILYPIPLSVFLSVSARSLVIRLVRSPTPRGIA